MEHESPVLNVYLGSLKKPWAEYCEALGKTPGVAIKETIEQQLAKHKQNAYKSPRFRQTREPEDNAVKKRFEILLTPSERDAIRKRAELENCSERRWVVDAIRAGLTKEPQFSMREIEMLGESNYQLLAIGRNLNQIAKAINEGKRNSIPVESIRQLGKLIDLHTEKVSKAIRASVERWDIE